MNKLIEIYKHGEREYSGVEMSGNNTRNRSVLDVTVTSDTKNRVTQQEKDTIPIPKKLIIEIIDVVESIGSGRYSIKHLEYKANQLKQAIHDWRYQK